MNLYQNKKYMQGLHDIATLNYNWKRLRGKNLAISGGTGMIGRFMIDVLMYRNKFFDQDVHLYVIGRNPDKAGERFSYYKESPYFNYIRQDINYPVDVSKWDKRINSMDYIIHAASPTHPLAYSKDPIGTITANVIGLNNLLSWGNNMNCQRFVFLSSVEIYGESRNDRDVFTEDYMGYIDCNSLRAGYPESKRTGEALCRAYISRKNMDIVIPRLSRVYGPTMLMSDSKAVSQFIKKGLNKEDIVLKSKGTQYYSYSYVADAVSAILHIMFDGTSGEAYNVASADSDITLKDLAALVADYASTRVVYEKPSEIEASGYSRATTAILSTKKLEKTGWTSIYSIEEGIKLTMDILRGK